MKTDICYYKNCDLIPKQEEIETWLEDYINMGVEALQRKYPHHHKDCLQRIFAEQLKIHHHELLGELIAKNLIGEIEDEQRQ